MCKEGRCSQNAPMTRRTPVKCSILNPLMMLCRSDAVLCDDVYRAVPWDDGELRLAG
jgi:hypothetical protein